MRLLEQLTDYHDPGSFVNRLRRRRFDFFLSLMARVPRPLTLLDVGGTQLFWMTMGPGFLEGVEVTLLNVGAERTTLPGFVSAAGDARDMGLFRDGQFDVVFSNSVIEHLYGYDGAASMAREVRRVGRRYFVQTPNRHFPIEPHFLFPCYQYLPRAVRVVLLRQLRLGHLGRIPERERACRTVDEIRLLSVREVRALFPRAHLYREKVFGLTKSVVAYDGWPAAQGPGGQAGEQAADGDHQ